MSLLSSAPLLVAKNSRASAASASGYTIERSLRFNSADSAYLNRTPSSAGNRKTWTWSGWVKRSSFSSNHHLMRVNAGLETAIRFRAEDNSLHFYTFNGSSNTSDLRTTAVFRDPSAWFHVLVAVDTTQATASNRVKFYVNGTQQTDFSVATYPSQNLDTGFNQTQLHALGAAPNPTEYFNGYLADVQFVDGQALAPTDFGEFDATTGVWNPIEYTGTFGTNGFHLDFADNSTAAALGNDVSGNNNDWTVNNISVAAGSGNDSLFDSPSNGTQTDTGAGGEVSGNYATLNPLINSAYATLTNGNLDLTTPSTGRGTSFSTLAVSSGKFYCEVYFASGSNARIGVIRSDTDYAETNNFTDYTNAIGYVTNGLIVEAGTTLATQSTYAKGDIIGVALDMDNGEIQFFKNNVSQGTYNRSILDSGSYYFVVADSSNTNGATFTCNFGQRPFAYTAPSGYKALCTSNLPTPTIEDGSTAMDIALYTGTGGIRSITGFNFSPDFVWIKSRSTARPHAWFDTVRGAGKLLGSDRTDAEATLSDNLTSFNSDGFSLQYDGITQRVNLSGTTYASWCWDAGSSTVSNTDGSITSSVRANASAGFSIVTYSNGASGSTVGHGLGVKPDFIITKCRTLTKYWTTYHDSLGKDGYLTLQRTDAFVSNSTYWGSSGPNSTTFGVWNNNSANNAGDMVAYCFAAVEGYSAFGSYTGNGSTDGPFVFTNFRPRWVMIKRTDTTNYWIIQDTARNDYNVVDLKLAANTSNAENDLATIGDATQNTLDYLSNGFKCRTSNAGTNASGGTYIYAAFAENPFKIARAR